MLCPPQTVARALSAIPAALLEEFAGPLGADLAALGPYLDTAEEARRQQAAEQLAAKRAAAAAALAAARQEGWPASPRGLQPLRLRPASEHSSDEEQQHSDEAWSNEYAWPWEEEWDGSSGSSCGDSGSDPASSASLTMLTTPASLLMPTTPRIGGQQPCSAADDPPAAPLAADCATLPPLSPTRKLQLLSAALAKKKAALAKAAAQEPLGAPAQAGQQAQQAAGAALQVSAAQSGECRRETAAPVQPGPAGPSDVGQPPLSDMSYAQALLGRRSNASVDSQGEPGGAALTSGAQQGPAAGVPATCFEAQQRTNSQGEEGPSQKADALLAANLQALEAVTRSPGAPRQPLFVPADVPAAVEAAGFG